MFENNYPFGTLSINKFIKGDLVYWSEWRVIHKVLKRFKKIGIFLGQKIKFIGNREITYGIILCSETGDTIEVLSVRLKKEETN